MFVARTRTVCRLFYQRQRYRVWALKALLNHAPSLLLLVHLMERKYRMTLQELAAKETDVTRAINTAFDALDAEVKALPTAEVPQEAFDALDRLQAVVTGRVTAVSGELPGAAAAPSGDAAGG